MGVTCPVRQNATNWSHAEAARRRLGVLIGLLPWAAALCYPPPARPGMAEVAKLVRPGDLPYFILGGTEDDGDTIDDAFADWCAGTAYRPIRVWDAGVAHVVCFLNPGTPWIYTRRPDGPLSPRNQAFVWLPSPLASVTALHELGHVFGMVHPSRARQYSASQREAIHRYYEGWGYSREWTNAQFFAPVVGPVVTWADGPSILDPLDLPWGMPSAVLSEGDRAGIRACAAAAAGVPPPSPRQPPKTRPRPKRQPRRR